MDTATLVNLLGTIAAILATVCAIVGWRRARSADQSEADPHADAGTGFARRLVAPIAARLRPGNQVELEALRTLLMQGGRRSRDAVDRYLQDRIIFIIVGTGCAYVSAIAIGGLGGLLLACLSLLGGLLAPRWLVSARSRERREAVAIGLPVAVDLLTTCIEAGLSLENALRRVARDMAISSPVLAEELDIAAKEIDAGVALSDALRRLARRVGLDDLSALCGVIAQAHGLGAPIGETLRDYAESSRRLRMNTLEERAGQVAAKLTIPLALFFLPVAILIILAPAIVQLARALG